MIPEEKALIRIDELLVADGWKIQDYQPLNLSAARVVAVREFQLRKKSAGLHEEQKTLCPLSQRSFYG